MAVKKKAKRAPAKKKRTAAKKKTVKRATTRRATAKRAPARKATARRKSAARKTTARKATAAVIKLTNTPIAQKQTKTQIINNIAENTELTKKQVEGVFTVMANLAERHVKKRGSGEFSVPDLGVKICRIRKKATKQRMGRNPATGEEVVIKAKPARDVIKVRPLKAIKQHI